MTGRVSLVGAGPGSPDLLTLRALKRLTEADLVLYDALVSLEVLALARRARRFYVGKRAGRPGMAQQEIHALMIRWATRGRHVVRLKCGDPFVLGRGGEELLALAAAGIPVEIVPGISSALAAPALAGIPLTQRGVASGFVVLSGHDPAAFGSLLDSLAPHAATLVVLMGLALRHEIAGRLIARGWNPATPAAVVSAAATDAAATWIGTLAALRCERLPEAVLAGPATLVIGEVVRVAETARLAQLQPAAASEGVASSASRSAWGPR